MWGGQILGFDSREENIKGIQNTRKSLVELNQNMVRCNWLTNKYKSEGASTQLLWPSYWSAGIKTPILLITVLHTTISRLLCGHAQSKCSTSCEKHYAQPNEEDIGASKSSNETAKQNEMKAMPSIIAKLLISAHI